MREHDQDAVLQILDRIASGRYLPSDLDRLRELTVTGHGNRVQVGKYNVQLQHGSNIHIGDRVYHGIDAEKIRSVLEDVAYGPEIAPPPGSFRSRKISGIVITVGYLILIVGMAIFALSFLQIFADPGSFRGGPPPDFIQGFGVAAVGGLVIMFGQVVRGWERRRE